MRVLLSILSILFLDSKLSFAQMTADEIIDRLTERKDNRTEQVQVTMKLQNASGKPRETDRTFRLQAFYAKNNDFKTLLTFLLPPGIKNTKVLTVKDGGATGQWIYLPSVKRVSRINSDEDVEGVLDSDLAFSDLKEESKEDYKYTLNTGSLEDFASKTCGEPAYSVTAETKEAGKTGYAKRVLSIAKAKFVVCGAVIYDSSGKVIKNINNSDFRQIQDVWRPGKSVIASYKNGKQIVSRTVLQYADWKLKVRLDPGLFSVNNLDK